MIGVPLAAGALQWKTTLSATTVEVGPAGMEGTVAHKMLAVLL